MAEAPVVELTLGRGPVTAEELQGIARTYGEIDPRYRSEGFCRTLFNENPFGYSFHAFVRDRGRIVGHNAVIPIRVRRQGRIIPSGKGEALYLEPAYRSSSVETEKGPIPAGIALMMRLYDHALADGLELLHNITSPDVGSIQLRTGFKRIDLDRRQVHVLLDPASFPLLNRSPARLFAGRALSLGQKGLRRLLGAGLRLTGAGTVRVNPPELLEEILARLARTDEESRPGWSVARDPETLHWMLRLDRCEILVPPGCEGAFALITKGPSRELVHWQVPPGVGQASAALWHGILARAERDGAALVSVNESLLENASGLRSATRRTGSLARPLPASLYIKSSDPYYKDVQNIIFDRMFNLT